MNEVREVLFHCGTHDQLNVRPKGLDHIDTQETAARRSKFSRMWSMPMITLAAKRKFVNIVITLWEDESYTL
jgi:hypothetical protein